MAKPVSSAQRTRKEMHGLTLGSMHVIRYKTSVCGTIGFVPPLFARVDGLRERCRNAKQIRRGVSKIVVDITIFRAQVAQEVTPEQNGRRYYIPQYEGDTFRATIRQLKPSGLSVTRRDAGIEKVRYGNPWNGEPIRE
jgi:hypothetical protein